MKNYLFRWGDFYQSFVITILVAALAIGFQACDENLDLQEQDLLLNSPLAAGDQVSITNPGFESNWSGWIDTDPSATSSDAHSGSKSAKITGSSGKFEQSIAVKQNTDYTLSAYILEAGIIGAQVGNSNFSDGGDYSDWTQVSVTFNSGSNSAITIYGAYGGDTGRFDDFVLTEGGNTDGGDDDDDNDPTDPTTGELSISSVSASANDGNVPANAIDEDPNLSTRWSANGSGQYITFDLGSSQTVSSIKIAWYKGNERSSSFKIRIGDSTSNLTEVLSASSSGSTLGLETYNFESTTGRYVRITCLGNSANTWNSITDVEIYGQAQDGGTDPDPDPDPVDPDPVDPTEPGTANIPSDLMENCNQWKITYPDGVEDKTLCGESNNEYFYVNNDKNAIVFRVPIRSNNGSTPNSNYIRSELRERTESGSSDIYWTTSGKHVVYVEQAITHLPMNKDHLVATQIHGNKADGIDDAMVMRLEGSHLFLSFNGGKLRSDVTIKSNYTLGTKHEVIFEVIDGKHYCYYSEDGNLASAYASGNASSYLIKDGSNSYVMNKSYGEAYFKVGNYTQSNANEEGSDTGNPNNYGEVLVYDFSVSHQ
ncbi:polysaccharide lyase family 7 protein [Reichenbachiella agarivorans]|uniref:Polysaccharide lyase family 7 protein n=1 Tax=Reichenbachiella agarivorans TaxID=2979464 RepID=A0ABY6CUR1_9BACT|nr:polysaccharide lyase family 7 protein [Reichenbachiella agarivorans]UXP33103.1 polysaccharide lyase family 7 protein [Reichenbachiella agarivorans]